MAEIDIPTGKKSKTITVKKQRGWYIEQVLCIRILFRPGLLCPSTDWNWGHLWTNVFEASFAGVLCATWIKISEKKSEVPQEVGWHADRQPRFLTHRFIRFLAGTLLLNPVLASDHLYSLKTVIKFVSLCLPLLITNVLKCQDHGKWQQTINSLC